MAAYTDQDTIEKMIREQVLIQLVDDDRTGGIDAAGEARVTEAIALADGEIDGYIETRYDLPLVTVPRLVKSLSTHISIYCLYARQAGEPPEAVTLKWKKAIAMLEKIAMGKIDLPGQGEAGSAVNLVADEVITSQADACCPSDSNLAGDESCGSCC